MPPWILRARLWQAWLISILQEQAWSECGPLAFLYQSACEVVVDLFNWLQHARFGAGPRPAVRESEQQYGLCAHHSAKFGFAKIQQRSRSANSSGTIQPVLSCRVVPNLQSSNSITALATRYRLCYGGVDGFGRKG